MGPAGTGAFVGEDVAAMGAFVGADVTGHATPHPLGHSIGTWPLQLAALRISILLEFWVSQAQFIIVVSPSYT